MVGEEEMESEDKKITLKERLKDKRERAKIELIFYGVFFLIIIIFARFLGSNTPSDIEENKNFLDDSFISKINDNYEYSILLTTNDNVYEYYGKMLGNNGTVNLKIGEEIKSYRLISSKYYVLEDDNYILVDEKEVYPYIDYRYLAIDNIIEYMKLSSVENNIYRVKISDIVLDSDSTEYLEIVVNEGDKNISIDYSPLLGLVEENSKKITVNITYYNIDKIISLDE